MSAPLEEASGAPDSDRKTRKMRAQPLAQGVCENSLDTLLVTFDLYSKKPSKKRKHQP
ncbi:MAG: hypothetical protein KF690_02065 [Bacteroidetes bacterium]|nr:hypothetical protein [Bacteroidota bacterium]